MIFASRFDLDSNDEQEDIFNASFSDEVVGQDSLCDCVNLCLLCVCVCVKMCVCVCAC